jgi:alanine racemase
MTDFSTRPTVARIDLANLRYNFRSSRDFIGHDVKYMAVVKANAYGHGAVECAQALASESIDWFGVALVEEAIELRESGIETPILCLGGLVTEQESLMLDNNVTPVVFNLDQAIALSDAGAERRQDNEIHIKIDTGMGRLGVRWHRLDPFIRELSQLSNLRVEGLMSHLAAANDPSEDTFTDDQIDRFYDAVAKFEAAGFTPDIIDLANSPGAVGHPRSRPQMVRLGGILYGLGKDVLSETLDQPELRPVMSLHSVIADIKDIGKGESLGYGRTFFTERDLRIALVPIGYNDGYCRALSNKASVIVNEVSALVTGRISMDWTIVDVTDVPDAKIGDDVILIGGDDDFRIAAEDLARICDTISYEITCGIGSRVPRRFVG